MTYIYLTHSSRNMTGIYQQSAMSEVVLRHFTTGYCSIKYLPKLAKYFTCKTFHVMTRILFEPNKILIVC
jgi:hypothetical protein